VNRRQAATPWLSALIVVGLMNAAFLLLGIWVATLPREPLRQRITEAFASGDLIENDWPWLESRHGFDQYNDCSILQMITNHDGDILANAVGPLIYNANRGETDKCATLRSIVRDGPDAAPYLSFRYTRYWHGYDPVAAALLEVASVGHARQVLRTTLYAILILLAMSAGTRSPQLMAVGASIGVTGLLFWAVPYFGPNFSHAPGDIVLIAGLAALLHWRERLVRPTALVPFCAAYGAALVYLEFLTGQLPTAAGLLLPVVYLIARSRPVPDDAPREAWRLALTAVAAFALGAVLTVAIKQILALVIVGPEALGSFMEYLERYVNPSPKASLRHFGETWASPHDSIVWSSIRALGVVLGEGYVLTYGSHGAALLLYAAGALAWAMAAYLTWRSSTRWATSDLLAMAAGTGIVIVWAWVFQTHTTLHKFWMVRMVLVPLSMGWGALGWQLMTSARRRSVPAGQVAPGQVPVP
jgi:hypothetical protein